MHAHTCCTQHASLLPTPPPRPSPSPAHSLCMRAHVRCCASAGAERSFTRRRQDAACLQGGSYKRPPPTNKTCACGVGDVECDYGYAAGPDGACTRLPEVRGQRARAAAAGCGQRAQQGARVVCCCAFRVAASEGISPCIVVLIVAAAAASAAAIAVASVPAMCVCCAVAGAQ